MVATQGEVQIGRVIKQLRVRADMTRSQLAAASGVSASHVTRIENGQRFPSARILRRIAPNAGIGELDLLAFAGYVSREHADIVAAPDSGKLDPYVVAYLSREPGGRPARRRRRLLGDARGRRGHGAQRRRAR